MVRKLILISLVSLFGATSAHAQFRFPGYGPANNFYVANGATKAPSWFTPAGARTAIGIATWAVPAGIVPVANGGAGVALTPSNGGVVYSNATTLAILAGTVTAGQCLLSGSSAAPTWGSCTGAAAVSGVSNSDGTLTISPTTGAVVASLALGNANTWTGVQTFNLSDLRLLGSSTGYTTLLTANAGAGNFTITIPAVTDTLATLAANQLFTGTNIFGAVNFGGTFQVAGNAIVWPGVATTVAALNIANQSVSGGAINVSNNIGTVSSGTTTVNCGLNSQQYMTNNGASTIAAPANDGACNILIINGASAGAITFTGFTVNAAYTGATMTTGISNKYLVTFNRVNGTSNYFVVPLQ